MEATVIQVLPVFVIVAVGYLAARFKYLPESLFEGLTYFVLWVAVPLYIFRALARSTLLEKSPGNLAEMLGIYFLGAALALGLGMAVARYAFKGNPVEQTQMGLASSHGSVALLGIPAVTIILASKAITALTLLVGLHGIVMAAVVTLVMGVRGRSKTLPQDLGKTMLAEAKMPIFIALVAGVVYNMLDLGLPGVADQTLQIVAVAGVPCGLFALGGALLPYRIGDHPQIELATSAVKLVAHPFIVWLLAVKLNLLGIPTSWAWAAVMVAAMPTGLELLLKDKQARSAVFGTAILVSTALGLVTVAVLAHLIRSS